jgi:hypothetical protein
MALARQLLPTGWLAPPSVLSLRQSINERVL